MAYESDRDQRRRRFFDESAENWETRNYCEESKSRIERMLTEIALNPGMTILDVGCGQGILLPFLRKLAGPDARLVALDASAAMLKAVAKKDKQALAVHAQAENMPLIDDYVDAIFCFSAFPHFSDHAAAAREFHRILKPGGHAYVLHLACGEAINRHHDSHPDVRGDHMPDARGMKTLFAEAGFAGVDLVEGPEYYRFSACKGG